MVRDRDVDPSALRGRFAFARSGGLPRAGFVFAACSAAWASSSSSSGAAPVMAHRQYLRA